MGNNSSYNSIKNSYDKYQTKLKEYMDIIDQQHSQENCAKAYLDAKIMYEDLVKSEIDLQKKITTLLSSIDSMFDPTNISLLERQAALDDYKDRMNEYLVVLNERRNNLLEWQKTFSEIPPLRMDCYYCNQPTIVPISSQNDIIRFTTMKYDNTPREDRITLAQNGVRSEIILPTRQDRITLAQNGPQSEQILPLIQYQIPAEQIQQAISIGQNQSIIRSIPTVEGFIDITNENKTIQIIFSIVIVLLLLYLLYILVKRN